MGRYSWIAGLWLIMSVALAGSIPSRGQEPAPPAPGPPAVATAAELHRKFAETLNQVKLVGQFTIVGQPGEPRKEEYEIQSVSKLPEGDDWQFRARIKYGEFDLTLPLRLEVKWAGDTPVITLTNFTIPALGTFGARVVIHDGKYAGTWSHGEVGGHMFGTIEKLPPQ